MLVRFGHIIPWILVGVLGLLALSILVMYRTVLFEGFDDTDVPPPLPTAVERARAINDMKTSVAGTAPEASVDSKKEVNAFILKSMTDMIQIYKQQPDQINKILGKVIDITDDTCYIMKNIQAKYTKQTVSRMERPSRNVPHETQVRQKKYDLQKEQFMAKNKTKTEAADGPAPTLLECFVGDTDISGFSFGENKTANPVNVTDIHAEDDKQIKEASGELIRQQEQLQSIMDSPDYKSAVSKLKKVPPTAEFVSEFITTNKKDIIEEYLNPNYKLPVPYQDSEINDTQKGYLVVLEKARELLLTLQTDLDKNFTTAVDSYTKLVSDFKTIDSSYKQSYRP